MKLPYLPIHIVTSKTYAAKLDESFDAGKRYSQKQIEKPVSGNAFEAVKLIGQKMKKKEG